MLTSAPYFLCICAVMFKDDAFQAGSALDKRGRQVKSQNRRKDLASLYQVETPEDEAARAAELAEADERWARMRGIGLAEDSSSSSEEEEEEEAVDEPGSPASSASPTEDEEDRRAREVFGVGALAANPREQVALVPDATRRLAAVDLDWTHVTAVDILAVLRSFLPASGRIERVTVYPSDYGLQRMAEEASAGPRGLWGAEGQADEEGADSDTERRRRRAYELSRLRYYYAVIECDNAATASKIYDECDGMEFLKSESGGRGAGGAGGGAGGLGGVLLRLCAHLRTQSAIRRVSISLFNFLFSTQARASLICGLCRMSRALRPARSGRAPMTCPQATPRPSSRQWCVGVRRRGRSGPC